MTYENVLKEIAESDDRLIVMTAENRAAIRNLPAVLGKRFIDVGIAEQTMIGAASGLALRGRIPVTHALATFLTLRAFEFIRSDVGIANLPVKLVGGVAGFLSDANGPTHQAIEDISLMRGIPNMKIFCPSDSVELAMGIKEIILDPSPWYIRYNPNPAVIEHQEFSIGKAEIISEGTDIAIFTYGFMLGEALKAKTILESSGKSVRLINLRTLKPVDETEILRAAAEVKMMVTIEDHFLTGGLFSIIGEIFLKHQVMAKVLPIALENRWFKPALLNYVLEFEGFTGKQIAEKISQFY